MAIRNPPWTRDELILALDLYFRFKISALSAEHPEVVALSRLLNSLPIHSDRPDAARFRNPNGVYMKLGNFSRLDPEYPGAGLTAGSKEDERVWAEFSGDRERLRAVAEAIRSGAQAAVGESLPEVDEDEEAPEGKVLFRQHRVRERKPSLVRKRKLLALREEGALRCSVCSFDFSKAYGALGEGYIECHHTLPLHKLRPGRPIRLRDLELVCSNCHRMLHRGGDTMTVAKLQVIMDAQARRLA